MLYRVLCLALGLASPAFASTATLPHFDAARFAVERDVPAPVYLYGFRFTRDPVPHPMSDADGNRMWDASGQGCIDGGGWDDDFPDVKGEPRSPAFCIPQPCARLMNSEELSRDVYGRPLEDGEYQLYLRRLEEVCGGLPAAPLDDAANLDIFDLLQLTSLDWVSYMPAADLISPGAAILPPPAFCAGSTGPYSGALRPRDFRAPSGLHGYAHDAGPFSTRPHAVCSSPAPGPDLPPSGTPTSPWPRTTGGPSGPWNLPSDLDSPAHQPPPAPGPDLPPSGTPNSPWPPTIGGPDGTGPDSPVDQPAPVPLPGGLVMLLSALGVLALRRRGKADSG